MDCPTCPDSACDGPRKRRKPSGRFDAEDRTLLRARWKDVQAARQDRDNTLGDDYPSIRDFYRHRHVLLTGATGFLGKVILEKLLRTCPDVGNVYLLLRTRRGQDVDARVKAILALPIFDRIRKEQPESLDKVVPVHGDCSELGLGLSDADRNTLAQNVSVVIHSAASVRFNDSVKKAVTLNVRGAVEIAKLAREMAQLKVLVHVSTAYCNTDQPLTMERVYPTEHDWRDVIRYASLPDAHVLDCLGPKFVGFQPNSYVFSKALAEGVMLEASNHIPVVITRPSIVTCAMHEPLPGWMDSLNGFAMFWAAVLKGTTRTVVTGRGPDGVFDIIPVDTVSDAIIAASWARGIGQTLKDSSNDGPEVINVAVADVAPSTMGRMKKYLDGDLRKSLVEYPGAVRAPRLTLVNNSYVAFTLKFFDEILFGSIIDFLLMALGKKPRLMQVYRLVQFALANVRYFIEKDCKFDTTNFWRLQKLLHPKDRGDFELKVNGFMADEPKVWGDQLLGVLRYALKESYEPSKDFERYSTHVRRLWLAELFFYIVIGCITSWLMYVRYF